MNQKVWMAACLFVAVLLFASCQKETTFNVLQFNIWQEGTSVKGGFDALADEIVRADADFVTLSEVRNYHDTRFCDRIVEALKKRGQTYYSFYSEDSGLLSRYPIQDSTTIYPLHNDQGTIYRMLTQMDGQEMAIYTAHLDYRNCAYYLPRGYDGNNWSKLESKVTLDSVLYSNSQSVRDDAIKAFLKAAEQDREAGRIVIIGGDFNEPSFQDWVEANKDMYDHSGLVVPWEVSRLLHNANYKDTYREFFPDPLTHPGFTCPAGCPDVDLKRLVWSPEADDRDRIDFIYYSPAEGLSLTDVQLIGPKKDVIRGQLVEEKTEDPIVEPMGIWPTDHKAVLATFKLVR